MVTEMKQQLALLRALTPAQRADPKPQLGSNERAQAVEIAAREMPVGAARAMSAQSQHRCPAQSQHHCLAAVAR